MLFKFKKRKITINCYTSSATVYNQFKIDYAQKFIPSWWKEIPNTYIPEGKFFSLPTIRTCPGMTGVYHRGAVIPLWSDLAIELGPKGEGNARWQFSDTHCSAVSHPVEQRGRYLNDKEFLHMKLNSPWHIDCEEDISWVWMGMPWNMDDPTEFAVPTGLVEYKYQNATNINLFLKYAEEKRNLLIPAGTPMVQIVPLDDRKIDIKCHLLSEQEFKESSKGQTSRFVNAYKTAKRTIKSSGCPAKYMR